MTFSSSRIGHRWRPASLVFVTGALIAGEACASRVPPLAHAQQSASQLARAVAGALERADAAELHSLALSEQEFRDHVWPELPASRPERNLPFSYVWLDLKRKSDGHLARILEEFGGQPMRVADVRFAGGTTQFQTYVVHRDGRVRLVHQDGSITETRLFGSVIEKNGQLKVFSYVVD